MFLKDYCYDQTSNLVINSVKHKISIGHFLILLTQVFITEVLSFWFTYKIVYRISAYSVALSNLTILFSNTLNMIMKTNSHIQFEAIDHNDFLFLQ